MTSYRPFALRENKESPWEGEKAGAEEVARAEEEKASKIRRRKRKLEEENREGNAERRK